MMRDRLNKLASRLPLWKRIHNRMMMAISAQIADIIDEKFNSRREFAESLGKKESEVSKWLSGTHNFTLKSLSKIEDKLETQFIFTSNEVEEKLLPYKDNKYDYFLNSYKVIFNKTFTKQQANSFSLFNNLTTTKNVDKESSNTSISVDGSLIEEYYA